MILCPGPNHFFISLLSFSACGCAPRWIILGTPLLCSWDGGKLAGTIFTSLRCGSMTFVKTLSMAANPCSQSGQCQQICHPGRRMSQSPHLQLLQSMQSSPPPTQHALLSPQWLRKNHRTTRCMSKWLAGPSVLALAANPLSWILPILLLLLMENEVGPHPGKVKAKSLNDANRMRRPFPGWTLRPLVNMVPACLRKVTMTVIKGVYHECFAVTSCIHLGYPQITAQAFHGKHIGLSLVYKLILTYVFYVLFLIKPVHST